MGLYRRRVDASNMPKPALARSELHCIGVTTLDEYRKHFEKDAALARRFRPVFVSEPSLEDTISILRGLKKIRSPSWRADYRRCDRLRRDPVELLYHGPVHARQGDQFDR